LIYRSIKISVCLKNTGILVYITIFSTEEYLEFEKDKDE
jgi:hypothetical protein